MNRLEKYTDEELFDILGSDVEKEIVSRGYEYGWHKKTQYAGVIYVLVNPAFPKLVKIGYADDVESRLKSLNASSGLPDPFRVYATYKVKKRLEDLKLHELIDTLSPTLRHSKNREFYDMRPETAYGILSAIAQINGDESLLWRDPDWTGPDERTGREDEDPPRGPKKPRTRKHPKPKLTFASLGIPIGSTLTYKLDKNVTVKTLDDKNTVELDGREMALSKAVTTLKGGGTWQGGEYFLYEGKKLTDIRKKVEAAGDGKP